MSQRESLEEAATRILISAALKDGAICTSDFDFMDSSPERCEEVAEFIEWLATPAPQSARA